MREWSPVTLAARRLPLLRPGRTRSDTALAHLINNHPCRSVRSFTPFALSDSHIVAEDCGVSLPDGDNDNSLLPEATYRTQQACIILPRWKGGPPTTGLHEQ